MDISALETRMVQLLEALMRGDSRDRLADGEASPELVHAFNGCAGWVNQLAADLAAARAQLEEQEATIRSSEALLKEQQQALEETNNELLEKAMQLKELRQ